MATPGTKVRTHRARVYFALVACLLWFGGVEGLPALHVAMHAHVGAHRHEGALVIPIAAEDRDPEVDALLRQLGVEDHDADAAPAPTPREVADAHARLARQLGHGHGSLGHHDLAVAAPAIPLHAPLPIDRRPTSVAAIAIATPISALAPRASARGPPLVRAA